MSNLPCLPHTDLHSVKPGSLSYLLWGSLYEQCSATHCLFCGLHTSWPTWFSSSLSSAPNLPGSTPTLWPGSFLREVPDCAFIRRLLFIISPSHWPLSLLPDVKQLKSVFKKFHCVFQFFLVERYIWSHLLYLV